MLLVGLVVGLHFRSVVAPLVVLAAVAVAYLVLLRVVAAIGREIGVSVPQEVEPVMVVLLFGIVTDYAVFLLSRFRRRLAEGLEARVRLRPFRELAFTMGAGLLLDAFLVRTLLVPALITLFGRG